MCVLAFFTIWGTFSCETTAMSSTLPSPPAGGSVSRQGAGSRHPRPRKEAKMKLGLLPRLPPPVISCPPQEESFNFLLTHSYPVGRNRKALKGLQVFREIRYFAKRGIVRLTGIYLIAGIKQNSSCVTSFLIPQQMRKKVGEQRCEGRAAK